ncbi:copper transport protein family [Actinidia rufa]|uniref:Copper transport protein family n=1 Tax=Actinidia rufa TaxID=165716 RepID=A0A7J0G2N8_9ERIC|nr:copper transport protein family [Actinidia rufa]
MKQKIVIEVQMKCEKCRSKALMTVATVPGVISVALEGEDRDRVVVTGEKVDATALTQSLRKEVGFASLESVEEVENKIDGDGEGVSSPPKPTPLMANENQQQWMQIYEMVYDPNPPSCTIL